MVKTKFKKAVSLMLAAVMSLTAFTGIGATTAFAAVGEKADVYLVDYPRSGDTNNNGEWGHGNLNYMNGWKGLSTKYTGLRAMGSYSGNIAYCIEPGTGQRTGDTITPTAMPEVSMLQILFLLTRYSKSHGSMTRQRISLIISVALQIRSLPM